MGEAATKNLQAQKRSASDRTRLRIPAPPANEPPVHFVQRLQRTIGNQAVLRLMRSQQAEAEHRRQGETARATATRGIAGASAPLPHLDRIQQSFGGHDVSGVKAHTGAQAGEANQELHSLGYAVGNHIAFAGSPDLHTAAHEAAHVVQQRAGVRLAGGVGRAGDMFERHADAVADLVVQQKSAESLLNETSRAGPNGKSNVPDLGSSVVLQRQDDPSKKQSLSSVTTFHATPGAGATEPERNTTYQQSPAAGQSLKSLLKSLGDALDRWAEKLKGDATQSGLALHFWGQETSSKHSTAAKPGKNVYFLNQDSFDVTELIAYMNLCLLAVSSRKEMFPQPKDVKSTVTGIVKLLIKAKKLKDYIEKENKKEKMAEGVERQKQSEAQNLEKLKIVQDIKKELGQIDISPLESDKPQTDLKKGQAKEIKKGMPSQTKGGFDPRNYVLDQWVSGDWYNQDGSYNEGGSIHIYTDKHGNQVEAKSWIDKAGYVQYKVLKRTKKSGESATQGPPPY
jgi:hypothetical protein